MTNKHKLNNTNKTQEFCERQFLCFTEKKKKKVNEWNGLPTDDVVIVGSTVNGFKNPLDKYFKL